MQITQLVSTYITLVMLISVQQSESWVQKHTEKELGGSLGIHIN